MSMGSYTFYGVSLLPFIIARDLEGTQHQALYKLSIKKWTPNLMPSNTMNTASKSSFQLSMWCTPLACGGKVCYLRSYLWRSNCEQLAKGSVPGSLPKLTMKPLIRSQDICVPLLILSRGCWACCGMPEVCASPTSLLPQCSC
eukprot:1158604-Pelagomonas_calceolata.AAC.4